MTTWLLYLSGPGEPAFNMAMDEALLLAAPRLGSPVLRFYDWTEPAATYGYFQKYRQVAQWMPGRTLVRRPTGGGAVLHGEDWTYSLVFPPTHPWYATTATISYRRLHEWLRAAFATLEVPLELHEGRRRTAPGQCFAEPEASDLIWRDRKIAGAAQRRSRTGFLIQGSVQFQPPWLARTAWQDAMCQAASQLMAVTWSAFEPDSALRQTALALARDKYTDAGSKP